ncbi:MAG TPA: hypothetical protein VFF63_00590 [Candidatus Babeliales bacterium]|nr:hypothetical protein [Candidatus Babeliales bacterium]
MHRYVRASGAVVVAALFIGIAACSSRTSGGSAPLPPMGQGPFAREIAPNATPTPPITAPVTIDYPYTNTWTTKTWSGPTAKPSSAPGSDTGVIAVKFALNRKTGIYDVLETIKSKLGYVEELDSAIGFLRHGSGIAQIILSDDYSYVDGPFLETGMDTYPYGQNSFDFPLTKGNKWSAAAGHTSYYNEHQSGKGSFSENVAFTEAADGTYAGQTSFSSLGHNKIQDNYDSTTNVAIKRPSVYTLSERAAGYNKLKQIFELPSHGYIEVQSKGQKPLPIGPGTVKVPDWYPGHGALPKVFYSDDFSVTGSATMPSSCGSWKGKSSSEVIERFANLDPVQGFYNTYTTWYYLTQLKTGQFWFACILEKYENDTFANDWVMSAGDWGKLSSEQVGAEALIASPLKSDARSIGPDAALPVLTFPSLRFRTHFGP